MKAFSSLFFFCLFLSGVHAQTVLDNNPARLRFKQINTPNFRIVFPDGFEEQAQRVANTMEAIGEPESRTMGKRPRKISIILQNQSSESNGFVSITPRRSEFFTLPPQNYNFLGTNDWLNLLSSHEYRHMVQFQHANRGFNKFVYYLFGQNALSAMAYVAAPQWFWEGDAVATETAFTPSGRGRIPNFGLVFKTNLLEGREFNYHKQYLRSYKNNIPNHYVLGYYMISYLRERTGDPEIWEKITARSWDVPFIPFAFSNAIKKESGVYVTQLYREMADTLRTRWQNEIDQLQLTSFETINHRKNSTYTDYLYPQPLADGSVVAMKTGIGDIQQFVRFKNGREEKVFVPGYINDGGMLSAVGSRVVWSEYGYSPRWRIRNYSMIKAYDRTTKTRSVLSDKQGRVSGASLSPDGQKVVAIRSDNDYQHRMIILDYTSQQVIKEFENPGNSFYAMPRWSDDGKSIVALKLSGEGKAVVLIDAEGGDEKILIAAHHENIGSPVLHGKYLLYSSPVSGIDNIYAFNTETQERFQVTTSKYGAYNPVVSPDQKYVYYNDQTRDGLDVVRVAFDPSQWKRASAMQGEDRLVNTLVEQENNTGIFNAIPQQQYPVTRFSKLKGMINPYTWGPYVTNDLARATVGVTSRDILGTTLIDLGYQYDINEQTGLWRANVSYQGWAPILDFTITQGNRSVDEGDYTIRRITGTDTTTTRTNVTIDWKERNIETGFRFPLNTTSSKYSGNFTIGNSFGFTHVYDYTNGVGDQRFVPALIVDDTVKSVYPIFNYVGNNDLYYSHFNVSAYRLLKVSRRDILSRWGQAVNINYYQTMGPSDLHGGLFSLWSKLYFPGLAKHHVLHGYWAYQETMITKGFSASSLNDYLFRNTIPLPRGQSVNRFRKIYSMSANYTFPLWYPDIAVGPLVNFQRFRVNTFFDYAFGSGRLYDDISRSYTSVGAELTVDINILRFLPQLDITFRVSKGIDPSTTHFDVILGTLNF